MEDNNYRVLLVWSPRRWAHYRGCTLPQAHDGVLIFRGTRDGAAFDALNATATGMDAGRVVQVPLAGLMLWEVE